MAYIPVPPDQLDRQAALQQSPLTGGSPAQLPPPPPRPPATAPAPYPGYMSPQDLAAFALQTIQQAYQPQLDYLRQQQRQSEQMHAAQQAGLVELYKILAGNMGSLGGDITSIFSNAAQGLNLPSDAVTGDLGVSRDIVGSGGAAGSGYGQAYPQLAGQQGQTEFLRVVQEGAAADQDIGAQIQKLVAEQPAQVQQLLQQLTGQQADYAKAAQPIIRSVGGSLVAVDPTTGRTQVLYQGAGGAGGPPKTFRGPGGSVYAWSQDKKGNWVPQMIAAPTGDTASPPKTVKGPGGAVYGWQQNNNGSWKLVPLVKGVAAGRSTPKPSGDFFGWNPALNGGKGGYQLKPGYAFGPGGVVVKAKPSAKDKILGPGGVPLTNSQINSYAGEIRTDIAAIRRGKDTLAATIQRWTDAGIPQQIWIPQAWKAFGLPNGKLTDLRFMKANRLHQLAVLIAPQDFANATRDGSLRLNREQIIKFITDHITPFLPKAEAAQGAAYNPSRAAKQTQPVSYTDWPDMIRSGATHYGLDPLAVLAVANAEGLGGGVGDSGTSFGPFQLHVGGALPRGKTQAWAESPAGIDYALRKIARVARGLTAREAIEMIVRRFERPADPEGEIERAWAFYQSQFV